MTSWSPIVTLDLPFLQESEVDVYSRFMVGFSATFVAATLALTRFMGSFGFILANCFNMALRIAYCTNFVIGYYQNRDRARETNGSAKESDEGSKDYEHRENDCSSSSSPSLSSPPHPLTGLRVPPLAVVVYAASLILTQISEIWIYDSASSFTRVVAHLGVGAVTAAITLGVVAFAERDMIRFVRKNWDERKNK